MAADRRLFAPTCALNERIGMFGRSRLAGLGFLALLFGWMWPGQGCGEEVSGLAQALGMQLPRVMKPAPAFSLVSLDGRRHALADARGHWVLLHFWATWCPPCRAEMRALHRVAQRAHHLRIVCVNEDRGGKHGVEAFVRTQAPGMDVLLDEEGRVRRRYAVRALPTSYLIAPDGRIFARAIGERDWLGPVGQRLLRALERED
ncbi:MAG: TlpA family protein disulfide reductase [Zetaproteobacteria bacterium]|nr:MAG: TlpA family protein disulfide reductase [Zetaproteobacteria bacterium]